jgi:predicted AAA+ superfamily ATPase
MCCYKIPEESEKLPFSPDFISEFLIETQNNENGRISFKLYMLDTGILSSVLKTSHGQLDEQNRKGLLENYVAQSLASRGYPLFFWESGSQAKVDFIISKDNKLMPIEVRTTDNTRSRNVSIFRKQFPDVTESIKISTRNFEFTNHVKYVPVYAVFCI